MSPASGPSMGNTVSVSWGDHVEWGVGPGRLATPEDIDAAVGRWQDELGADTVLWREHQTVRQSSRFFRRPGATPREAERQGVVGFDEHAAVIEATQRRGMRAFVYTTIGFDEGWPLELDWWGGVDARQSKYVLFHPDHQLVDRDGDPHHGVLCLAYEEVRAYLLGKFQWLLEQHPWDGLFLCTRSQSRPASYADRFGFNRPVVDEYRARHGIDITVDDFDLSAWRSLHGEQLTRLLREVRAALAPHGTALTVGIPRADHVGPPVGNTTLEWRTWMEEGLVDELVIDQIAAVCPSTWLEMWPRDRGYGYLSDDSEPRPELLPDLQDRWGPTAVATGVPVSVARMWQEPDPGMETALRAVDGVRGTVHSSFRWTRELGEGMRGLWPG